MARLASQSDFEGGDLYTNYRRYPFFAERAAVIHERFPTGKILVVGCGWGYLVDELLKLGRDVWGIDASSYAINKGKSLSGNTSAGKTQEGLEVGMRADTGARLLVADTTSRQSLAAIHKATDLTGNDKFAVAVTEDMLPCLTDAEVTSTISELRLVATSLLHCVTPANTDDPEDMARRHPDLNWKKVEVWKALVNPDLVYDEERRKVV